MKSYFKFLSRNKLYTGINVVGLAVSLMFVILIGDYSWRQFSIDAWHKNADRIYVMGSKDAFFMWPQVATEMKEMCPDVEKTCRIFSHSGKIKYGQREMRDNDHGIIMLADSTFFDFFDFELKEGQKETALDAPDKCLITESLAKTLFAGKNPIGESLNLVGDRHVRIGDRVDPYDSTLVYTVSGVVKDLDRTVFPNETQVIASMQRYGQVLGYELPSEVMAYGGQGTCKVMLMLRQGASPEATTRMAQEHLKKNYSWWRENECTLTPFKTLMFAPQNTGMGLLKGDKSRFLILFSAVLAILFFAVSNYINLTVANTGFRAKEMATRRLLGSSSREISLKLMAESTLMVAVSFVIGLALAFCFQQDFAELFKGKIALQNDVGWQSVGVCVGFILLLGILSGMIPSWQISRLQPLDIVKGMFRFRSKMVLSKVFIIIQNVLTVIMLTAAFVIALQLYHLIHAPLGFNTENLFYIWSKDDAQTMRSKLEAMPFVEAIGQQEGTTFTNYSSNMTTITNNGKSVTFYTTTLDTVAWRLMGLTVLKEYGHAEDGVYLTEEMMRQMGFTKKDRVLDYCNGNKEPIAGVLKDFHRINVLNDVQPFAIRLRQHVQSPNFLVKTNGTKAAKAAFLKMLADMNYEEKELRWSVASLEENVAESFEENQQTLNIVLLFTMVAIVISIMGFVGMSLFFIRQRKNEIGLRKIMGSTSQEVMSLMLRTFLVPLFVSFIIAVPLSWYIMNDWLTNFSYRITLSPWMLLVPCLFSLLIAFLSVFVQIGRAVRANPIESIKTE
jgi:putative ABC transport system permease protein